MGVAFAGSCDRKFSWRSRGNFALSYVLTVSFNDDAQFYVRFGSKAPDIVIPFSSCAVAVQEAADLTQEERTAAAE